MSLRVRLLVFAKAPRPGQAKTRLIPALGADGAARLAARLLGLTLRAAVQSGVGAVELCATPEPGAEAWAGIALPAGVECSDQGPGDLGQRMACAARRTLARGEVPVLIGTDCPELAAARIAAAVARLADHDAVIHPAHDGGYVLLGLRDWCGAVFEDMPWGTETVGAATIERLRACGARVWVGAALRDLDRPDDLAAYGRAASFRFE
ncbi:MAG: TIGR04282 family arsenosugar biosynthesis glycosyltransferase [Thiotrichales bacterium]